MTRTTIESLKESLLGGIEIPIHLTRVTPIIAAVKKFLDAETMRNEAVTELEHLLNIELPKSKKAAVKGLTHQEALIGKYGPHAQPKLKVKLSSGAKKTAKKASQSAETWRRYAESPARQTKVLDAVRGDHWATMRGISEDTGLSTQGVSIVLNKLEKLGKVKKVIKSGNPLHGPGPKERKFTYWAAV